jgi:hypothetical protein
LLSSSSTSNGIVLNDHKLFYSTSKTTLFDLCLHLYWESKNNAENKCQILTGAYQYRLLILKSNHTHTHTHTHTHKHIHIVFFHQMLNIFSVLMILTSKCYICSYSHCRIEPPGTYGNLNAGRW